MAARLRRALLLPLTFALVVGFGTAQACEKHLRGHSGSDSVSQAGSN